jgi:hypothetical protein
MSGNVLMKKKNRTHPRLAFFRAALHNAKKPHAAPYGFAQPVYYLIPTVSGQWLIPPLIRHLWET